MAHFPRTFYHSFLITLIFICQLPAGPFLKYSSLWLDYALHHNSIEFFCILSNTAIDEISNVHFKFVSTPGELFSINLQLTNYVTHVLGLLHFYNCSKTPDRDFIPNYTRPLFYQPELMSTHGFKVFFSLSLSRFNQNSAGTH